MSDVKFSCPGCAQHIAVNEKYAGRQMICPSCKTAMTVPEAPAATPAAARTSIPVPPAPPRSPSRAAGPPAVNGNRKTIALLIVAVAAVVGGGIGGFVAFKKGSSDVDQNSTYPSASETPSAEPVKTAPNQNLPNKPRVASTAGNSPNPWPQFRGPNRDGKSTETGLLKLWPSDGPPLLWKVTGLGGGYSSVSVADGKVFTMGDGSGGSQVHAIDENTGRHLWQSRDIGRTGGNREGPKSTPAVDLAAGNVYALGQFGDLVCLKIANGREVWRKSLTKDFGGKSPKWNYAESPLLDGDRVLVSPGGRRGNVVALNKDTGATIWQSKQYTDEAQYVSMIISPMGLSRHYITMSMETVAGISAQTGNLLWRIPRKGATAVIPSPLVYKKIVFVTSGYKIGCTAFQISSKGDRLFTRRLYSNKDLINHHGGVVLVDQYIYGHSDRGGWKCMDITTGKLLWEDSGVGKGSVVYADGHLICRSETGSGKIALIEATPRGYVEKGRFAQPERSNNNSWAHPVVANGKLFIRDQDVLLCFDLREG